MTSLTKRQRQVLALLALGYEPAMIAHNLSLSKRTVDFHVAEIYNRSPRCYNRTHLYHAHGVWGMAPAVLESIAATGQMEATR